jgi:trehalose 6-phosphate phosphatase
VSGRSLEDLKDLLPVNGFYLAGGHGAELEHPDGSRHRGVEPGKLEPVINRLAELARDSVGTHPGFIIENKKTSLALHYRLAAPETARLVLREFKTKAGFVIQKHGLEIISGKKVAEVRHHTVNKGKAVRYLMDRFPEYYPIYLGDDITDEDAFMVVKERGAGILVAETARESAAQVRLPGQREVLKFIKILSAGS